MGKSHYMSGSCSRVLLKNRDLASRVEYSNSVGKLLQTAWDEAFGDSFEYLTSRDYVTPGILDDSVRSLMRTMNSFRTDKGISSAFLRRLIRSTRVGDYMHADLGKHAVVSMTVHFLMTRDGDCASLIRLLPLLLDTNMNGRESCAIHYDSLMSFCPDLIDELARQNVFQELMGIPASREARNREVLSLTDRDDINPSMYERLWTGAVALDTGSDYTRTFRAKVGEPRTTWVHAMSMSPHATHPVERLAILTTVVAPQPWSYPELNKLLLDMWGTHLCTLPTFVAHATCYVNMYPFMYMDDPDMMVRFCTKVASVTRLFANSQDRALWEKTQEVISSRWCSES